jgi:limonene-1,2-epoxide hydrolase
MRKVLLAVALAPLLGLTPLLGAAANSPATVAESKTADEAARIAVVKAFAAAWNDPDKAAQYLSEQASVRMEEDKPAIVGRKGFIDGAKLYVAQGQHFSVRFVEIFARGPVVVTHRIDTVGAAGKADVPYDVVGVFVVKDGKIVQWDDYINK